MLIEVFIHYAAILLYFMLYICIYFVAYFCRFLYVNKSSLEKKNIYTSNLQESAVTKANTCHRQQSTVKVKVHICLDCLYL